VKVLLDENFPLALHRIRERLSDNDLLFLTPGGEPA